MLWTDLLKNFFGKGWKDYFLDSSLLQFLDSTYPLEDSILNIDLDHYFRSCIFLDNFVPFGILEARDIYTPQWISYSYQISYYILGLIWCLNRYVIENRVPHPRIRCGYSESQVWQVVQDLYQEFLTDQGVPDPEEQAGKWIKMFPK